MQMLVDILDGDDAMCDAEATHNGKATGDVICRLAGIMSSIAGKDRQCKVPVVYSVSDGYFIQLTLCPCFRNPELFVSWLKSLNRIGSTVHAWRIFAKDSVSWENMVDLHQELLLF